MKTLIGKYIKSLNSKRSDSQEVKLMTSIIILLFFLSVLSVYVFPIGISKLIFLIFFILFWFSSKDYFWFAFFIIITLTPSGFFQETSSDVARRLPLISIVPKASLSVMDLFLILSLIKAYVKGKRIKIKDVLGVKYIFYFAIVLSVVTMFHGISLKTFIGQPLRGLFFYTIFFSFPSLVYKRKDVAKFLYMFLPFVFFEVFSQGYLLYTGDFLQNSLFPEMNLVVYRDKLMEESIRSLAPGYSIVVMSFIFCFVLYDSIDRMTSKVYLIVVMLLGTLSMFLSATRQSIIMFALMFILYVIFVLKNKRSFMVQFSIIMVVIFFVFDYFNILDLNFTLSAVFDRLIGAIQIKNGTFEAEDTLDYRLSYRLPLLWSYIKQSIILGYGYSDDYFRYYDGHIGGIMVALLQAGITGLIFYALYVVRIYKVTIFYIKKYSDKNTVTNSLKSLLVGMSGFVLLNTFINPMLVLNFSWKPQEFFIVLVLLHQYIYYGKREYFIRKKLSETNIKLERRTIFQV